MRATELFADFTDWSSEHEGEDLAAAQKLIEEEYGVENFFADDVKGLRILELEDFDMSEQAIESMDAGEIQTVPAQSIQKTEGLLVAEQEGYSVRIALIDLSAGSGAKAVQKAMISDVDLIVAGPYDATAKASTGAQLEEAARSGYGVFTLTV